MQFRIEATRFNPSTDGPSELVDRVTSCARRTTRDQCQQFWRRGIWVEVFDAETHELLAGPIDPDLPFPSYIV